MKDRSREELFDTLEECINSAFVIEDPQSGDVKPTEFGWYRSAVRVRRKIGDEFKQYYIGVLLLYNGRWSDGETDKRIKPTVWQKEKTFAWSEDKSVKFADNILVLYETILGDWAKEYKKKLTQLIDLREAKELYDETKYDLRRHEREMVNITLDMADIDPEEILEAYREKILKDTKEKRYTLEDVNGWMEEKA